jgi:poly-gamma-glutamate capsule biosynthesis protein CapA/YwtB (metallophosphatase superfamily)
MGLFLGFTFYGNSLNLQPGLKFQTAQISKSVENLENKVEPLRHTTIAFVGDIMLDRGVKYSVNKNFAGDYSKIFENADELKNYDITFANLEGPVSDAGNNVGSIYSFRMDPKVLAVLKDAGFDIVSFANNHVGDWNVAAFKDTLKRLGDTGIMHVGAGLDKQSAEKVTIIEKNGIKFGFLGFSDVGPNWIAAKSDSAGLLLASDPKIKEIVENAKKECDVLIVSFHWGEEYKLVHNKRQEELAHTVIDAGADMVIGHHPHVVEDIGSYKDKPIVYSLGNFIFDQYFSTNTMQGMMYTAEFDGAKLVNSTQKTVQLNRMFQIESIK